MKSTLAALGAIAALLSAVAMTTASAEAKGVDHMIKKKDREGPLHESFVIGSHKFTCIKTGDCGDWNIRT